LNKRIINIIIASSMIIAWSSAVAEDSSIAVFKWMRELEGDWALSPVATQEGKATSHSVVAPMVGGDQVAMSFRVIGAGSTVQESLLPGTPREMVTMYHCQDTECSQIKATHYCVKQNQPQMTAANTANDNSVVFNCDMSTALCQSWDDHVHSITHEVSADGTHLKTTYSSFMNGEHTKNSVYHFDKKM
jgi:hypothetical protein